MSEGKKPSELDPTQAPRVVPGTRVATPSQANTSPGADDTLAPEQAAAAVASSPPIVVRAGGKDDYRDLRPIDPQHYVVGKEIARGGMGRILTARDRRLGRPVAIKELLATSADLRARFEREARITAKLQHPSIVNKAGALAEYQAGLVIARRLQAKDPTNADWRKLVADLTSEVATCCGAKGRPAKRR